MEERIVKLKNASFLDVLDLLETSWHKILRPAYIHEQPNKSITKYYFEQPIRKYHKNMKRGRITYKCSTSTITKNGIIAGLPFDKAFLIFECWQIEEGEKNLVEVQGLYPKADEQTTWIKSIFESVWQDLLARFSIYHNC